MGRALDAIAGQVEHIVGSVGAAAVDAFGIDVARLHRDMTSISVYGAYDNVDADHPAPACPRALEVRSPVDVVALWSDQAVV